MKLSEGKVRALFVAAALFTVPVADSLSGLFVPLTYGIRGLAGVIGHSAIAVIYGGIIGALFASDRKALLVLLPASMVMAGLLRSMFFFFIDDRVFDFVDWWGYMLSSKFGFNWLIVMPIVAFLTTKWVVEEPKAQSVLDVQTPTQAD